MHILEFFDRIKLDGDALEKRDESFVADENDLMSAYFLADEAFDQYFSGLFSPALRSTSHCNYVLSAILNFSVHQLTMRLSGSGKPQRYLQIGSIGGHEIYCANLRNYSTPIDVFLGYDTKGEFDELRKDGLAPVSKERLNFRNERFEDYFNSTETKDSIGVLALINCTDLKKSLDDITKCWNHLDDRADIIVQGDPEVVVAIAQELNNACPSTHGSLSTHCFLRNNRVQIQGIMVLQTRHLQYHRMANRIQNYDAEWSSSHLFFSPT